MDGNWPDMRSWWSWWEGRAPATSVLQCWYTVSAYGLDSRLDRLCGDPEHFPDSTTVAAQKIQGKAQEPLNSVLAQALRALDTILR
jgi:hypothetical protein